MAQAKSGHVTSVAKHQRSQGVTTDAPDLPWDSRATEPRQYGDPGKTGTHRVDHGKSETALIPGASRCPVAIYLEKQQFSEGFPPGFDTVLGSKGPFSSIYAPWPLSQRPKYWRKWPKHQQRNRTCAIGNGFFTVFHSQIETEFRKVHADKPLHQQDLPGN